MPPNGASEHSESARAAGQAAWMLCCVLHCWNPKQTCGNLTVSMIPLCTWSFHAFFASVQLASIEFCRSCIHRHRGLCLQFRAQPLRTYRACGCRFFLLASLDGRDHCLGPSLKVRTDATGAHFALLIVTPSLKLVSFVTVSLALLLEELEPLWCPRYLPRQQGVVGVKMPASAVP